MLIISLLVGGRVVCPPNSGKLISAELREHVCTRIRILAHGVIIPWWSFLASLAYFTMGLSVPRWNI